MSNKEQTSKTLNLKQRKTNAQRFAQDYKNEGYEKGQTQQFWYRLLKEVVGLEGLNPKNFKPEHHVSTGGYCDVYLPDSGVVVEQKSRGIDLDTPEERQGKMVTPFQQALNYALSFRYDLQPQFIIVCNFQTFRIYDRKKVEDSKLENEYISFELEELPEKFYLLDFITDPKNSKATAEEKISIQAGEAVKKLFYMLQEKYIDPTSDKTLHSLNVLCVRLVFCLFCEDTNRLFPRNAFLDYLKNTEPGNIRISLMRLFKALNTPLDQRDPYDDKVKPFPYVNGGLFEEEIEIPNFDANLKHYLLFDLSQQINWSSISPTVFGGIFESTLNPETRSTEGMHYTSPENIHKVIDPLFLDDLYAEYAEIKLAESMPPKTKKNRLEKLLTKVSSLHFFDPACGSGNFLTETYTCLRELEDDILLDMNKGQTEMYIKELAPTINDRVKLSQFHGIELNDFAVSVANVALWIAQLKANEKTEMMFNKDIADFPLVDHANIVCANALRMDWNDVLPAEKCSYIIGNPPFVGARNQTKEQKAEVLEVYQGAKNAGNIDYVACWYMKAAQYVKDFQIRCAFVSTNSICQGEQVANVWKPLYDEGISIDFAHNTFRWQNEASNQAHVFCIIVGFSKLKPVGNQHILLFHKDPDTEAEIQFPNNINAYLVDAPNTLIWNRNKPICNIPKIGIGNKPIDGGNYLFTEQEMENFIKEEPESKQYFKQWMGSAEFINNKKRYVLWLGDTAPGDLLRLPKCRERIEAVREYRLASKSAPTRKIADKPQHFHVENMPEGNSIIVPRVSSERRKYVPMGFISSEIFCSDAALLIPNTALFHFGILQSTFHNAWMRIVCGRLESRYRYSGGIVYNNFIWPGYTLENISEPVENLIDVSVKENIETYAQAVLDARELHNGCSLADMYDPNNSYMFPELVQAHDTLDKAVEEAYGVNFNGDEEKIVAHLFKLYSAITN